MQREKICIDYCYSMCKGNGENCLVLNRGSLWKGEIFGKEMEVILT